MLGLRVGVVGGPHPLGEEQADHLPLLVAIADQYPLLLAVDDRRGWVGGADFLAVVVELDVRIKAIVAAVGLGRVDHQPSLRRKVRRRASQVRRKVRLGLRRQPPEPFQQLPAILIRHGNFRGAAQRRNPRRGAARVQPRQTIVHQQQAVGQHHRRRLQGNRRFLRAADQLPGQEPALFSSSAWMHKRNRQGEPPSQTTARPSASGTC